MVLTCLPLTMTGRDAVEDCAWAARNKAQPQKKMPLAAAPLRKSRRAVIACSSLQVQTNNPRNCFTGATVRDSVSLIRVSTADRSRSPACSRLWQLDLARFAGPAEEARVMDQRRGENIE